MSAIAGIINFSGQPVAELAISGMTRAMALRGPDGCTHVVMQNAALGHCQLHTTSQSLAEVQPLLSLDRRYVLVMDGYLDNVDSLCEQLQSKGWQPATETDPELVLLAYQCWGEACLHRLSGGFAFAIWDTGEQRLFCARDHTGTKPLHYLYLNDTLVFASSLQAFFTLPWVPERRNEGMLVDYLAGQVNSNTETFWEAIARLAPAHYLHMDARGVRLQQYWEPEVHQQIRYADIGEYADHYRALLTDVVRRQSRSHQVLACEVSGGLDSSALFGIGEQLSRQHQLLAPGVSGYGLVFPGDADADEVEYLREVGRFWNRTIEEVEPCLQPLAWYQTQAQLNRDFPGYPNGIMNLSLYARASADGSRVVLSGIGGDEWAGGSRAYYADTLAAGQWQQLWRCLQTDRKEVGLAQSLYWLLACGLLPQLPFALRTRLRRLVTSQTRYGLDPLHWLQPSLRKRFRERQQAHALRIPQVVGRPGQRSQLNTFRDYHYMQCLEYMERHAADCGLEVRRPLFHPAMVEFSLATPEFVRLHGQTDRYLHRIAMRPLMPDSICQRHSKAAFMSPFHYNLKTMRELLTVEIPRRHPDWISGQGVKGVYRNWTKPRYQGWPEWLLWQLFCCDAIFETS